MKALLKKIKRQKNLPGERNPTGISHHLERFQVKVALWLAERTVGFTSRHWRAILLVFIMLTGGSSLLSLTGHLNQEKVLLQTPVSQPAYVTQPQNSERLEVSPEEYRRITGFLYYMDSLRGSPKGAAAYNQILKQRPGLLDSIRWFKQQYKLQNKQ